MNTESCLRAAAICGVGALLGCLASPALASFFDVIGTNVTAGPPYPSMPPITVHVTDDNNPPRNAMIEDISYSFSAGLDGVPMSASVRHDTRGPSVLIIDYNLTGPTFAPTNSPPVLSSFFDIFAPVGLTEEMIPGPASFADSFFDVFFDVQFSDGGIMSHHLHGQIPPGQDVAFTDVSGVMAESVSQNMVHCRQIHALRPGPNVAWNLPLMTVELTGSYVPEPATMVLMFLGVVGVVALSRHRTLAIP